MTEKKSNNNNLKPGQKFPTPTPGFGDRVFYETLLRQRPNSTMAQEWYESSNEWNRWLAAGGRRAWDHLAIHSTLHPKTIRCMGQMILLTFCYCFCCFCRYCCFCCLVFLIGASITECCPTRKPSACIIFSRPRNATPRRLPLHRRRAKSSRRNNRTASFPPRPTYKSS
jgi:hypothetical protein